MAFRDSGSTRLLPSCNHYRLAMRLAFPELCKVIEERDGNNFLA